VTPYVGVFIWLVSPYLFFSLSMAYASKDHHHRESDMGFLKSVIAKNQARKDVDLLAEEKLYEYVGKEMEAGEIRSGLWTKATSTATSSKNEDIRREYIRLRVKHLNAEGRLFNQLLSEVSESINEEQEARKACAVKDERQLHHDYLKAREELKSIGYKIGLTYWSAKEFATSPAGVNTVFKSNSDLLKFVEELPARSKRP